MIYVSIICTVTKVAQQQLIHANLTVMVVRNKVLLYTFNSLTNENRPSNHSNYANLHFY